MSDLDTLIRDRFTRLVSMFPQDSHEVRVRTLLKIFRTQNVTREQIEAAIRKDRESLEDKR